MKASNVFRKFLNGILLFILTIPLFPVQKIHAEIESCYAIISPSSTTTDTQKRYTFTIENQDSGNTATWVNMQVPDGYFELVDASAGGWNSLLEGGQVTYTGGTIAPGQTGNFYFTLKSLTIESTPQIIVQIATQPDGSDVRACDGNLLITIAGSPSSQVSINNVSVSTVTDSSANISFSTNTAATSEIRYGTTTSYGSTKSISSATTSHSYTLDGLTKNTTYHYQVYASANGTNDSSGDQTFTTAAEAGQVITLPTNTPNPTSAPDATPTPIPDRNPPVVTIDPVPVKVAKTAAAITGSAGDNSEISSLQYSVDNGKTWLTIKDVQGMGSQTARFSFTPQIHDGTNSIIVRAKDGSGNTTNSPPVKLAIDLSGPAVTVSSSFEKPFAASPLVSGVAMDTSGVGKIEYSIDGGVNWQAVDTTTDQLGGKKFSFTPPPVDDGDYVVAVRAYDSLGNVSRIFKATMVIDRLPPRFGARMLLLPPHILEEDAQGHIKTIAHAAHRFTVSAIGGANIVELAMTNKTTNEQKKLPLTKSVGTTLWSTDVTFPTPGAYALSLYAKDGGGNELRKDIEIVDVITEGTVVGPKGERVFGRATLYVKDEASGKFVVWDGAPYGQQNPVPFIETSAFSFYPPSGAYYIQVNPAFGYKTARTDVVTLTQSTPLTPSLTLESAFTLHIGPWTFTLPTLTPTKIPLAINPATQEGNRTDSVQGISVPKVVLKAGKKTLSADALNGRRTLLVVTNTWNPQTSGQITMVSQWQKTHSGTTVNVVFPHETQASIDLFTKRGGYTVPMFADRDGDVITAIPYGFAPTYYLVGTDLRVIQKSVGIQTPQDLDALMAK